MSSDVPGDHDSAPLGLPDNLIARYCRGDEEAFRRFYRQEAPRLWRFLVARGCGEEDAYDLVGETFLRFITSVCRDPAYPRALLYRIALNARIDTHRRAAVRATSTDPEVLESIPVEEPDLAESLAVRQAMDRLYPDEQNLLLMRYWLGMTHAEVARALQLPEGTVRRQAAEAMRRLRGLLVESG